MRKRNQTETKGFRRGFTLVEIMVVVLIIGLLAGIVSTNVISRLRMARVVKAKADIKMLDNAVQQYYLDTGEYPTDADGLGALIEQPPGVIGWDREGYLSNTREIPKDPWGNEYIYIYPGEFGKYDIISYGADGKEGGEGNDADIYNSSLGATAADEGM